MIVKYPMKLAEFIIFIYLCSPKYAVGSYNG